MLCYASAVFAVVVCSSVRHKPVLYRNHWSWFLVWRFPCSCLRLSCKEIWVPLKVRVLFSGTLSQTLDLENFATASQSHCRQNSSMVELVDDTCMTVDESWLFTTRRSTAICCGFVVLLFVAFSALTLLAGRQEEHPACTNRVMRCWCGYLSGARCRLFSYGPADATAIPIISCLI